MRTKLVTPPAIDLDTKAEPLASIRATRARMRLNKAAAAAAAAELEANAAEQAAAAASSPPKPCTLRDCEHPACIERRSPTPPTKTAAAAQPHPGTPPEASAVPASAR